MIDILNLALPYFGLIFIGFAFPQAKPMKINPKYGSARLRMSIMGNSSFLHFPPRIRRPAGQPRQG